MTDREIIERLAEFMAWTFTDDTQVIGEHTLEGALDTVWYRRDDGTIGATGAINCHVFDPFHDPAACALVLDEIERRGWWNNLCCDPRFAKVGMYQFKIITPTGKDYCAESGTRHRAVCLAVLEALEDQ